ncbi:Dna2-domain-containing protein [Dentipellis sp. KUC8613]|nr:Dna2-domain-containing protein [Dentipellis sp. KUC8613]
MSRFIHTDEEEDRFLQDLLSGFDSPVFADPAHKVVRPVKPGPHPALRRDAETPPRARSTAGILENSAPNIDSWDWDALSDYVPTPQKPKRADAKVSEERAVTRCYITHIEEKRIRNRAQKESRIVVLEDDWVDAPVRIGDVVNVIGSFPSDDGSGGPPTIHINKSQNLLIHHPDLLLTPTALSSAPHCTRRPILTSLLRSSPSSSAPANATPSLIYGNVLHDVFQRCLRQGVWDAATVESWIDGVLRTRQILGELVRVGIGIEEAKREVLQRARGVFGFGSRYIGHVPKPDAILVNTRAEKGETSLLAISDLYDVEEDIWAPEYGLKGKLDASVQAVVVRKSPQSNTRGKYFKKPQPPPPGSTSSFPAPLEIKTGRAVAGMEHRAQTMLYTLLMRSRYSAPVEEGLLYYTQSEEVISVPAARNEIRGLIGVRNEIAEWMMSRFRRDENEPHKRQFLPETIDDERICGRCFALDACMVYRKAIDEVVDTSSPIADIYDQKTGHLTAAQAAFFKHWEHLIALEEHDLIRFKKELWTLGAKEREARGRCFAGMVLDPTFSTDDISPRAERKAIHQATYKFIRRADDEFSDEDQESLLNGHMNVGDAITVSAEPGLLALASGYILDLTPTSVIVGVGHVLDLTVIESRISAKRRALHMNQPSIFDEREVIFRIDRDELSGGMGRIRDNLAGLFFAGGDSARLRLVVDLAPPKFTIPDPTSSPHDFPKCQSHMAKLNSNQVDAIEKVLSTEDYALVLGMPGTGKTTLVAALIRVLVDLGKTVLLSAYTHSAVDTILAKLQDADFGILRLGNVDKVHPDIRHLTLAARREPQTVEELERQLMTPPVVATTALSIDHREARKGGLDMSLFRRLSEAHPSAVVDLTHQYRMNADIMLLSNRLIYDDRLRCGSEEVAQQSLVIPDRAFLGKLHINPNVKGQCGERTRCWLDKLMDEDCKAMFVDTDTVPAPESRAGDLVQNEIEAALVQQVVETLLRSGVNESQIGVITPYRQQIKLLAHLLQAHPGVEILTADRSQGRDKDCVVLSMVRSNEEGYVGDLVRDWRRLNVAFTRASRKLIVLGSRKTLAHAPMLEEFLQLMESRNWILQLPVDAHLVHAALYLASELEVASRQAR